MSWVFFVQEIAEKMISLKTFFRKTNIYTDVKIEYFDENESI